MNYLTKKDKMSKAKAGGKTAGRKSDTGFVINFEIEQFEEAVKAEWADDFAGLAKILSEITEVQDIKTVFCALDRQNGQFGVLVMNVSQSELDCYIKGVMGRVSARLNFAIQCVSSDFFTPENKPKPYLTPKKSSFEKVVKEVDRYIDENYMRDISLGSIAGLFHFNKEYFSAMYRKISGRTITGRIQETRLEKAKSLLADADLKIFQVVEMVGYSSHSHFIKLFEERYNITPSEYRKSFLSAEEQENDEV